MSEVMKIEREYEVLLPNVEIDMIDNQINSRRGLTSYHPFYCLTLADIQRHRGAIYDVYLNPTQLYHKISR
jgi:hypothetical protein